MPNGWKQFEVDCGPGWVFTVTLRPRIFARLEEARASGGEWGASIGGKMGERTKLGFVLEQPGVQAFVKKPKATADAAQAPAVEEAAPIAASATGPTEAVGASAAQAESPRPE